MIYQIFTEEVQDSYDIAILIKPNSFDADAMKKYYIDVFEDHGISKDKIIAYSLYYSGGKVKAKEAKEYLAELIPTLEELGVKYIYCADAAYFKILAKQPKAESNLGYKFPVANTEMEVTLGINHGSIKHNPDNFNKLLLSVQTVKDIIDDNFQELGSNIIDTAYYPSDLASIQSALDSLHNYSALTCDIECYSLDIQNTGLGTIAFAIDKNNGVAFSVDFSNKHQPNIPVRNILKEFFKNYQGKLIFHNANYDVKVLVYQLFMTDFTDTKGMLDGIEILTKNIDDTKIIAYLATNSASKPPLSLKYLAHEFAGNYAQDDIKDIRKIPEQTLLKYNLVDTLATWFVYEKHMPDVINENQIDLYNGLMMDSMKLLLQVELTGMPVNPDKVQYAKGVLQKVVDDSFKVLDQFDEVAETLDRLREDAVDAANLKIKREKNKHHVDMPKYQNMTFNPNSGTQLQVLLFEVMELPVLGLTETKQPSTSADIIESLLNHCTEKQKPLIQALIDFSGVKTVLSTFIPVFEAAILHDDGFHYIHGNFNIGGTVSGRLSSSNPNLQNIPSGSMYGHLIKDCFIAPQGMVFCGADFNALEDMVFTLLTKDPNRLKIYIDGFCGHCLRAVTYWPNLMPDINPESVKSVNSIKKLYPVIRQDSKEPSFLLQYGGTFHGLMKNCGFPRDEAMSIEANFHELYKHSDDWVKAKLEKACSTGYVELAFGLKLRTPLLKRSILGNRSTLYEAEAEARTAGNALSGQSYGLLNNRAAIAFMKRVHASKWKYDIKPVALIHDAIYLLIRDDIECVEWVNRVLIEEMKWQDLPELHHEEVKLGAELDLFYPSWAYPIQIPNNASQEVIQQIINKELTND